MQTTIQVVMDSRLVKAADAAAKRGKMNRSALIRQALDEHLKRLRTAELEELDRRGYERHPQKREEYECWESIAAWPQG